MIEPKIDELIAALNANTAAHMSGGGTAPASAVAPRGRPRTDATPKITFEHVKAAVFDVKDKYGKLAAVKIINEAGGAKELAAVKQAKYVDVMAACEALLGGDDGGGEEGAGDDTL